MKILGFPHIKDCVIRIMHDIDSGLIGKLSKFFFYIKFLWCVRHGLSSFSIVLPMNSNLQPTVYSKKEHTLFDVYSFILPSVAVILAIVIIVVRSLIDRPVPRSAKP